MRPLALAAVLAFTSPALAFDPTDKYERREVRGWSARDHATKFRALLISTARTLSGLYPWSLR